MKYHFIPIQSIFGSWKNSIASLYTPPLSLTPQERAKFPKILNTQFHTLLTPRENVIEDEP